MSSTIAYNLSYVKLLAVVHLLRGVIGLSTFIGRLRGKLPARNLKPFESFTIPSTKSNRKIRVNAYRNKAALRPDVGPVAVHLNWHGSGFILYAYGESIPFVEHVLSSPVLDKYPLVILDCDYAKAPEYPCPAAPDDVRDALEYVLAHPETYNTSKVTVGGFSAGATFALGMSAAVGKEAREAGKKHPINGIITFYPPTEYESRSYSNPPAGAEVPGLFIIPGMVATFDGSFFLPHHPMTAEESAKRTRDLQHDPLVAPFYAKTEDLPKNIVLVTCEWDVLTEASERFRKRLTKEGAHVEGWEVKGVAHAWDVMVVDGQVGVEERNKAWDLAASAIARA